MAGSAAASPPASQGTQGHEGSEARPQGLCVLLRLHLAPCSPGCCGSSGAGSGLDCTGVQGGRWGQAGEPGHGAPVLPCSCCSQQCSTPGWKPWAPLPFCEALLRKTSWSILCTLEGMGVTQMANPNLSCFSVVTPLASLCLSVPH